MIEKNESATVDLLDDLKTSCTIARSHDSILDTCLGGIVSVMLYAMKNEYQCTSSFVAASCT